MGGEKRECSSVSASVAQHCVSRAATERLTAAFCSGLLYLTAATRSSLLD